MWFSNVRARVLKWDKYTHIYLYFFQRQIQKCINKRKKNSFDFFFLIARHSWPFIRHLIALRVGETVVEFSQEEFSLFDYSPFAKAHRVEVWYSCASKYIVSMSMNLRYKKMNFYAISIYPVHVSKGILS